MDNRHIFLDSKIDEESIEELIVADAMSTSEKYSGIFYLMLYLRKSFALFLISHENINKTKHPKKLFECFTISGKIKDDKENNEDLIGQGDTNIELVSIIVFIPFISTSRL